MIWGLNLGLYRFHSYLVLNHNIFKKTLCFQIPLKHHTHLLNGLFKRFKVSWKVGNYYTRYIGASGRTEQVIFTFGFKLQKNMRADFYNLIDIFGVKSAAITIIILLYAIYMAGVIRELILLNFT